MFLITAGNQCQGVYFSKNFSSVLQIRIRVHWIHMFLGLPDRDQRVRGMDPGPALDLGLALDPGLALDLDFLSLKNDVNVPSKSKKQKKLC